MQFRKYTYFNIAGPEVGYLVNRADFERQLAYSILFEPGKLIIPDAWVFGCQWIVEDVLREQNTLFSHALRRGRVAVNFRKPKNGGSFSSFNELLNELREINIAGISPKADKVADNLTPMLDLPDFTYETWPPDMGDRFRDTIQKFLRADDPPNASPFRSACQQTNLRRLWEDTRLWRQDLIERAYNTTRDVPGAGLRQTEIIRQLVEEVGGDPRHALFLADALKIAKQSRDHLLVKKVRAFIRWIWECHQYTQASSYGAAVSFPLTDRALSIAPMELRPPIGSSSEISARHRVALNFEIPDPVWLAGTHPDRVVSAREEEGDAYTHAVAEWQRVPSDHNKRCLEIAGDKYAQRLNFVVRASDIPHSIITALITRKRVWPIQESVPDIAVSVGYNAIRSLGGAQPDWISVMIPWTATRVFLEGCAFYQWFRMRPRGVKVQHETVLQSGGPHSRHLNFAADIH